MVGTLAGSRPPYPINGTIKLLYKNIWSVHLLGAGHPTLSMVRLKLLYIKII